MAQSQVCAAVRAPPNEKFAGKYVPEVTSAAYGLMVTPEMPPAESQWRKRSAAAPTEYLALPSPMTYVVGEFPSKANLPYICDVVDAVPVPVNKTPEPCWFVDSLAKLRIVSEIAVDELPVTAAVILGMVSLALALSLGKLKKKDT